LTVPYEIYVEGEMRMEKKSKVFVSKNDYVIVKPKNGPTKIVTPKGKVSTPKTTTSNKKNK
jgi:hypothetical protein